MSIFYLIFKLSIKNGKGEYRYATGDKNIGVYENDLCSGFGIYYY